MEKAIRNFPGQFLWEPVAVNEEQLPRGKVVVVAGMGGSHLAAGILQIALPRLPLQIHHNYGLPPAARPSLLIAVSYSGNTEETIDAFEEAGRRGWPRAAIATGGRLLELAKETSVPYVQLPATGIQPRSALGFTLRALLKLLNQEAVLAETTKLAQSLSVNDYEPAGRALSAQLRGKIPVIYSSERLLALAYNWKIKFNETGKIPAFYNTFPELNHNEMTSFDSRHELAKKFHFIFLQDEGDQPRTQKRMAVCRELFQKMGLDVNLQELTGASVWQRLFESLLIADWTAYHTARLYGHDPEQVPLVEEFKIRLRNTK